MGRSPNCARVSGTYGSGRRTFPSREPSPPRHTLHGALDPSPSCGLSRVSCGPPSHADDSRPHSTPQAAHPTCAHHVTHPGATRPRPRPEHPDSFSPCSQLEHKNNHTENLSKKLNLSTRHTWTTYHFNEGTPGSPSSTWWAPGSNCGKYRLDLSSRGPVLLSPGDLSTCCGVIGRRCCAQQVLIARPLVPSQVFDGQRVSPRVGRLRLRRLRVRVCRPCRRV